jgi:hypothetical protein
MPKLSPWSKLNERRSMKGWLHMERSRVRKEHKLCMVCNKRYFTGAMLIFVGKAPAEEKAWGLCPAHRKLRERNLIALVEVDPTKSMPTSFDTMLPDQAQRTGLVIYLSRSIFNLIFQGEPPDSGVAFVPPEVVAILQKIKQGGTQH